MTFKVYQDSSGDWRWSLVAENGKIVADSAEGYENRSHALRMVQEIIDLENQSVNIEII